jgi:hypothetical protein
MVKNVRYRLISKKNPRNLHLTVIHDRNFGQNAVSDHLTDKNVQGCGRLADLRCFNAPSDNRQYLQGACTGG